MIIESHADLVPVVARLRAEGLAALDTEFVWTRTYFPRLGIVQLAAADGTAWVADAAAAGPALAELLADPDTLKILHDARQDLALLAAVTGAAPRRVFDTRLAAGFAGCATTVSLKQLLRDLLEVDLPKTETRTDWCRRPLSEAQLEYALDDVRHLGRLRQTLLARVAERGATGWLEDELRIYDDPRLYAPQEPEDAWRRVRGGSRLAAGDQPLLRALAALRESRAAEWDMPRNWVVDDESLIMIATRKPSSPEAVRPRHRLQRERLQTLCREICAAVRDAARGPEPGAEGPVFRSSDGALKMRVDAALAFLRLRGAELRIDPALLGSRAEVTALVATGAGPAHPLCRGWRLEAAGRELSARLAAETPGLFKSAIEGGARS